MKEKETETIVITAADQARETAKTKEHPSEDFDDIVRLAALKIERAVEQGELECEIEVEPGVDWRIADLLGQCGYEVRRARRGVLSVSWA